MGFVPMSSCLVRRFGFQLVCVLVFGMAWAVVAPSLVDGGQIPHRSRKRGTPSAPWTVTIIESKSKNGGHIMDDEWRRVAQAMGHKATVVGYDFLDNPSNLDRTDVLIVASALLPLERARVGAISRFLKNRGGVYLQTEYKVNFPGNVAYQKLVSYFGGSISWGNELSGDLQPVKVVGDIGRAPQKVEPLTYFWWGLDAKGSGLSPFLLGNKGQEVGWNFCAGSRPLMTTTDQDWIKDASQHETSEALMKNIIDALARPCRR